MDFKEGEELRNDTGTDDTVAWNKKKGRRVSFAAEMTSVHVFDRDEDSGTPLEGKNESDKADQRQGLGKELEDSDDFRERNEGELGEEDLFGERPFLLPFESPSSGSGFGGSATSNDEDDFFGPLSSEFIRPGRLSDSVASDDGHEITMDSTAFSMHFRSLAMSESGDLKTPTESHLVFEEKTPTQSGGTTMQGSSMELTGYEKSVPHVSIPVDKFGSGKDSNDMSIVEDNPRKYDYATISPSLVEFMEIGGKSPHGISIVASSDAVNVPNCSGKKSNTTADLGNPSVHDSATASEIGREELLASSPSSKHRLISDSLLQHEQITERPSENEIQFSSQLDRFTGITEDLDANGVEELIPSARSGKPSELSSPVLPFGLSSRKEHNSFYSQGDLLKHGETAYMNDISYQKFQSHSAVIPYKRTVVEQPEAGHGEGMHGSDTAHITGMHEQSPSIAVTSLVDAMKAKLAMNVGNSSGKSKLLSSDKLGGSLSNQPDADTDVRYSSVIKITPRSKLDGVSSLICTPVDGHSSMRSKLSYCIVKTPQDDLPVSRLEDQFSGVNQGQTVQKMTADVVNNEFMPSEKVRGSLLYQAGTDAGVRSPSKKQNILRLKLDGGPPLSDVPVVGDSTIRSKLPSCTVKTPQHVKAVSRLEDQLLDIDQGQSVQRTTAGVDGNVIMTPRDRKGMPAYQLTTQVKEVQYRLSTLEKNSEGTETKSENISSLPRMTHSSLSDEKFTRIPDMMVHSQNQCVVAMASSHHNDSSCGKLPVSPRRVYHDVAKSDHAITDPSSILYDNTGKSNDAAEKNFPSQRRLVGSSPTRNGDIMHAELNRHTDETIHMSPGNDGDSMEIILSGNYSNVVALAQNLDNIFKEENLYHMSPPLSLIDQVKSPHQARSLFSGDPIGVLHDARMLQIPSRSESISSSGHKVGSSGRSFTPNASMDEFPSKVRSVTNELLSGAFEKDVMQVKAPGSSLHKRRHNDTVTGNKHSTPEVDKLRSSKIQKKGAGESVNQNGCSVDDQSSHGSMVEQKHWPARLYEAVTDSEQLYPTSVERLDLRNIEMLECVLIQMQKVHGFIRICSSIQTQSGGNQHNMERIRRIFETKELLQKMLYEQANLKLMRMKREKLLKRVEIIRSNIQDCQTLKLNCPQLRECVKCNARDGNNDPQSLTAQFEGQHTLQVAENEMIKMRQQVNAVQRDIDSLTYSFHACLKLKEKTTDVDTITLINDHLKRRALFKALREDVQMWKIDDVVYKKGQNQISLNYHGYLIQRFTLISPVSTVTFIHMLSHPNIEKNYPNMDAPIAFSSVFKVDVEQKYVGMRRLVQQTQVTSSVLSSLLEVIEEVKLARLELKELKEAKFLSPSAGKLHLCLHFVDFKMGTKVNITLDVSCLTRGIYPSDVLPSQLQLHPLLTEVSLPDGLQAALENLKSGCSRISRICKCISQALLI